MYSSLTRGVRLYQALKPSSTARATNLPSQKRDVFFGMLPSARMKIVNLHIQTHRHLTSSAAKPSNYPKRMPWLKRATLLLESETFRKGMALYWTFALIAGGLGAYYYVRDRYHEDIQVAHIKQKYNTNPDSLSEYEFLVLKKVSLQPLRTREANKFKIYQLMRKEFRRQHLLDKGVMFNPNPEELDAWYQKQARLKKEPAPKLEQPILSPSHGDESDSNLQQTGNNLDNPDIVTAQDTLSFYENKAAKYDDEITWEERGMFLGSKRKWLVHQMRGDVLEVACGTGRNIPYLKPSHIRSITFLDVSRNMVDIAQKKFTAAYPKFTNAAFTVGRAEDLVSLAAISDAGDFKYDTIVESFGLCAHKDPVTALKNMKAMLKPGGRIVLMEHGRSTWDFINDYLDKRSKRRMETWACRWNLDIGELIEDADLDVTYERRAHLGTTWLLVCKKPEDLLRVEEKLFVDKLFGRELKPIRASPK